MNQRKIMKPPINCTITYLPASSTKYTGIPLVRALFAAAQYQPTRQRVLLHGATKRRLRLSRQLVHLDEHDHLRVATVVYEDDTSGAEASHTLNRAEYPSRH
jgi:hypothetical protein